MRLKHPQSLNFPIPFLPNLDLPLIMPNRRKSEFEACLKIWNFPSLNNSCDLRSSNASTPFMKRQSSVLCIPSIDLKKQSAFSIALLWFSEDKNKLNWNLNYFRVAFFFFFVIFCRVKENIFVLTKSLFVRNIFFPRFQSKYAVSVAICKLKLE